MAITSYSQFRNANNNVITVSGAAGGYNHATDKYMADGIIQVAVSTLYLRTASAIHIKHIPYKCRIYDATFLTYGTKGLAGADLEVYLGTASAAASFICSMNIGASRTFYKTTKINFNNSTIPADGTINLLASGMTAASAAAIRGMLTLYVRPV